MSINNKKNDPQRFAALVGRGTGSQTFYNGLQQANGGFLEAVIRYGCFQEYHFFVEDHQVASASEYWKAYAHSYAVSKKVRVIGVTHLPDHLATYSYDVVHKGDPYIAELAALRALRSSSMFAITGRAHTVSTDVTLSKTRDLLLSSIQPCDAILCSSAAQQRVIEQQLLLASKGIEQHTGKALTYSGQLAPLPLGVDAIEDQCGEKEKIRQTLGYPADACILLCVGRFSYQDKMDLHPLLLAANDLLEKYSLTHFLIVIAGQGDASGSYIQSLLQQGYELNLEGRIRFELSVDDAKKHQIFQAVDVFVSISDNMQESFGLAPVEAMSYSLPVVLSDWNGYRELVIDGESGCLVETLSADLDSLTVPMNFVQGGLAHLIEAQGTAVNVSHFVETLHSLICCPKRRETMGQAARQRVLSKYHWPLLIGQYHQIVDDLRQANVKNSDAMDVHSRFSYQQVFYHYPTRHLKNSDCLQSTGRAIRILLTDEKEFSVHEIDYLLDKERIKALVFFCMRGATVASIYSKFGHEKTLAFVLVWLCKYHWLDCMTKKPVMKEPKLTPWLFCVKDSELQVVVQKSVQGVDPLRRKYLLSVMGWLATCIKPLIDRPTIDDGILLKILRTQLVGMDEKLLQAIGWFGEAQGLKIYSDIMTELERQGGFIVLQMRYPHWFRLGKRMGLRAVRSLRQLFERLEHDLAAINQRFSEGWSQPAIRVVDFAAPLRVDNLSVAMITFDNGETLVYKNRDIRIDSYLVDQKNPQWQSLAEKVNEWLQGATGIGTYAMLPRQTAIRKQKVHYGFVQSIPGSEGGITLTDEEGGEYYQRLGTLMGFGLMLGMTDLHTLNVISYQTTPFLIDVENIFQNDAMQAMEQEVSNPSQAFMRGITGSSLDKLCILEFFQNFQASRDRLGAVSLQGNQIAFDALIDTVPALINKVTVCGRSNLEGEESPLPTRYRKCISQGIYAVVNALCHHQKEWLLALDGCSAFQVRFQPIMSYVDLTKRVSQFHTFEGFQQLTYKQLKNYFSRSAARLCTTGVEVQRWAPAHWQESVTDLKDALATEWLKGCQGRFVKYPDQRTAYVRKSDGSLMVATKPGIDYFTKNALEQMKHCFILLASDDDRREQYLTLITGVLEAWLNDSLKPALDGGVAKSKTITSTH